MVMLSWELMTNAFSHPLRPRQGVPCTQVCLLPKKVCPRGLTKCILSTHSAHVTFWEKEDTPLDPRQETSVSCIFLSFSHVFRQGRDTSDFGQTCQGVQSIIGPWTPGPDESGHFPWRRVCLVVDGLLIGCVGCLVLTLVVSSGTRPYAGMSCHNSTRTPMLLRGWKKVTRL